MLMHEDDWDKHWTSFSEAISENPAQEYRHRIVSRLAREARPARLLDIGSGQGDLLARLANEVPGAELHGFELSEVGVQETLDKIPTANVIQVDLLTEEARDVISDVGADFAVCVEVLEHLDDPRSFLVSVKQALIPGATLVVTVPGGPRSSFDRLIGHRRHYSGRDLRTLLESAGFDVRRVGGFGFPMFNLYRLVIIARGDRLATDITNGSTRLAKTVMRVFGLLLRTNSRGRRFGWQTIGIATVPFAGDARR